MIVLEKLKWSNWFAYGKDNELILNEDTVTQVLGVNGAGKSSIPIIIEELLYGKNSKGVKKSDLVNRDNKGEGISAELEFTINSDKYIVVMNRKSTIKMSLYKNGKDISSHTTKGTLQTIENLLGIDFKTFSQLIYQSSTSSLEFLTATDTQRKNFLINLLRLDRYTVLYNCFKEALRQHSKDVASTRGSIDTYKSWIDRHSKEIQPKKDLILDIPNEPTELIEKIGTLKEKLKNIDKINSKITDNNTYKAMLASMDMNLINYQEPKPEIDSSIKDKKSRLEQDIRAIKTEITKLSGLVDKCPTCGQPVDISFAIDKLKQLKEELPKKEEALAEINKELDIYNTLLSKYNRAKKEKEEFESISLRIDNSLSDEPLHVDDLTKEIKTLEAEVKAVKDKIRDIQFRNQEIKKHNDKMDMLIKQKQEYEELLAKEELLLKDLVKEETNLNILRQTFSTNGLVSYKIETLISEVESEINKYLSEFSNGRFVLEFKLKDDKLNISINDNGESIDILSLSSGELARVNVSTLLAIRKLMSSISSSRINVLFLDEIMGVLDSYGKEKLIEVLLDEKDLNTFLVSHEYTHPLLEKITVVKDKNGSKITHG